MLMVCLLLVSIVLNYCLACRDNSSTLYNRNARYSTNVTFCLYPSNESEIIDIIHYAQNMSTYNDVTVRAIGKSYAFSAIGMMEAKAHQNSIQIMLNLTENMRDLIDINEEEMKATFQAGISVNSLAVELQSYGYGIPHYGGPGSVNFIGSAMTGTHGQGTGINPVGTMASNIAQLRLVTANGSIIIANNTHNKDIFDAARISFGCLGIITEFTVQLIPTFNATKYPNKVYLNMNNLSVMVDTFINEMVPAMYNYSHMYTNMDIFGQRGNVYFCDNVTTSNKNVPVYNRTCYEYGAPCTDIYFKAVFWNPDNEAGWGRNQEAELFVDESVFVDAWIDVMEWIYAQQYTKLWNDTYNAWIDSGSSSMNQIRILTRFVGADDIWLSPSYNRTVVKIGLFFDGNSTHRSDDILFDKWLTGIHKVLQDNYTPTYHWGKQSLSTYCDLGKSGYPKLEQFKELREILDPNQLFVNQFVRDKLGLCDSDELKDNSCCCTNYTCIGDTTGVKDESELPYYVFLVIGIGCVLLVIGIGCVVYKLCNRKRKHRNVEKLDEFALLKR
eukprot:187179_1